MTHRLDVSYEGHAHRLAGELSHGEASGTSFKLCLHQVAASITGTRSMLDPEVCILDQDQTQGNCEACQKWHEECPGGTGWCDVCLKVHTGSPSNYTYNSSDSFGGSKVVTTFQKQTSGTCVPTSMSYASAAFNGSSLNTPLLFNNEYYRLYGTSGGILHLDGMDAGEMKAFLDVFFNTMPTTNASFNSTINNGGIIMTTIATNDPNVHHNVTITARTESGDYVYMDTEVGSLCSAPESYFSKEYSIGILGLR